MARYVKDGQVVETSHPGEGVRLRAAGFVIEDETKEVSEPAAELVVEAPDEAADAEPPRRRPRK